MKLLRRSSGRFNRNHDYSYPELRTRRPRISRRVGVTGRQEEPDSNRLRQGKEGR